MNVNTISKKKLVVRAGGGENDHIAGDLLIAIHLNLFHSKDMWLVDFSA